jgi:type IV pilus assembly protein PilN
VLIDIDLLPQKEKTGVSSLVILILIAVLVFASAGMFFAIYMKNKELDTVEQQLSNAVQLRETLEMSAANDSKATVSSAELLNEAITWADGMKLPATPILAHLIERLPERGFFQALSYSSEESLIITIQFDTSRDAAYYLSELKSSEWIDSAKILTLDTSVEEGEEDAKAILDATNALPRYVVEYEIMFNTKAVNETLAQEANK